MVSRGITTISLFDYRNRGTQKQSGNVGDMIQTISMFRIISKWLKLWDLIKRRKKTGTGFTNIKLIPRDEETSISPSTLNIIYGWHMHKNSKMKYSFPPKHDRAIVTSFHVCSENILDTQTCSFLRKVGPIGCRDMSTLQKLRIRNIPSFYSGCITHTLPKPKPRSVRLGEVAIDTVAPNSTTSTMSMWSPTNKLLTQKQMWTRALCVLRLLRRTLVTYTSRLHILYPCIAMGTVVKLQSPSGDARLDWGAPGRWATARLYTLGKRNVEADGKRMEKQLATSLGMILDGKEITQAWRKAVVIHIAFCFDSKFVIPTMAAVNSLLCHNGDLPLHIHFFHYDVSKIELDEFSKRILDAHPGTSCQFHKCDGRHHSGYKTHLRHVSAHTMQRLYLHELLPMVDRVIYIDGDMIIRGSLLPLIDMKVKLIAARNSTSNLMKTKTWNNGFPFVGSTSFNAGLMIMNLDALRKTNFSEFVNKLVSAKQSNDQSILNLFCQGRHTELNLKWNFFMHEEDISNSDDPPIVLHFCGSMKPWVTDKMYMASEWKKYKL
jgi:lipopolysaccharide biosynthesis glycosyltransferase